MTDRISAYVDRELWTGDLTLELRNGRDWSAGLLEIACRRDTLQVRHLGHTLAVLDRVGFGRWLSNPRIPHTVDDTTWTMSGDVTVLSLRYATYSVRKESLDTLLQAILQ